MQPLILQYRSPNEILQGVRSNALVVTAQVHMAKALKVETGFVTSCSAILKALQPDWFESVLYLQQFLLLSRLIDERSEKEVSPELISAFKRNRSDLLENFRTFAEIGLEPELLPESCEEQQFFKLLYAEFSRSEDSGVLAMQRQWKEWQDPGVFLNVLEKCRPEGSQNCIGIPKAIYFQGFYYIWPMQGRLMSVMQNLRIPFYFLNAFDSRVPDAYEIWKRNPRFAGVHVQDGGEVASSPIKQRIYEIKGYEDLLSMVRDLRHADKRTRIYAPAKKEITRVVETFFPKNFEKQKLLSYPAGQYLWLLYCMWDDDVKDLILDEDIVRKCLATGWAGAKRTEAAKDLETFEAVKSYFADCRNIVEWQERVELYEEFDEPNQRGSRWNPQDNNFYTIGVLNIPTERVKSLFKTMRNMLKDARELFSCTDNGEVNLSEHFSLLYKMIQSKASNITIRQKEREILAEFQQRLQIAPRDINSCSRGQLADAMRFLLGGDREANTSILESFSTVLEMANIETAFLRDSDAPVHVCFCDADSMPGSPKPYSWPVTGNYLRSLSLNGEAYSRLKDYVFYMENTLLSNRYLFHLAKQLPNVSFSWVKHRDDKEIAPSIYLTLLNTHSIRQLPANDQANNAITDDIQWDEPLSDVVDTYFSKIKPQPEEFDIDRRACKFQFARLLYDYGLSNHPEFTEDFHLSFLFSALIALYSVKYNDEVSEVGDFFWKLFPAISPYEREEILAWATRQRRKIASKIYDYENEFGNLRRLFLHYLPIRNAHRLISDYLQAKPIIPQDYEDCCKYCPHRKCCIFRYRE